MIGNHIIQGDLVTNIRADATITALLASSSEARESQYQGADFAYPALRVHIDSNKPILARAQCDHSNLLFTIRCFAEGGSSRPASQLAAAVNSRLHRRNFHGTGWYSWFYSAGLMGPRRVQENLWMVEEIYQGVVYPTVAFVVPV